jgi:membrane associated rhomboid family serine protease
MGSVRAGEQIRLISSAFLHADIAHLAFNMITLYFFAPVVIGYLGSLFVIVYFGSLVCGSLLTILFHKTITITELLVPGAVTGVYIRRYYCSHDVGYLL